MMRGLIKSAYRVVKNTASLAGYDLHFTDRISGFPSNAYEVIHTTATYAPWRDDVEFLRVYEAVRPHTLVSKERCYELWSLVKQSAKAQGAIIEVGVWRGGTGAILARGAELSGITDPVYLCDTFDGVVKAGDSDTVYVGGEHRDTSSELVSRFLSDQGLTNTRIVEGVFPDSTASQISDTTFRLCHIDVDTYQSARDVFEWVLPRMSIGGIVVFDDYGFYKCAGVNSFVNEILDLDGVVFIYNLNGHAVCIKT